MQYKQVNIREAEMTDILALTELMNELGYDTAKDEMKIRFANIQNHEDYKTYVAAAGTHVVGMVGMTKNYSYEQNGIYVRVLALVINYDFRQNGIGSQLMEESENWAREMGQTEFYLIVGIEVTEKLLNNFIKKKVIKLNLQASLKNCSNF